jgi:predicted PurR-regulated permease PerM
MRNYLSYLIFKVIMQERFIPDRILYIIGALILLIAFLLLLRTTFPLFDGIVLGIVFAYVSRPIKAKLTFLGEALSSGIATLCVIVPIVIVVIMGVIEAIKQLVFAISHQEAFLGAILEFLAAVVPSNLTDPFFERLPDLIGHLTSALQSIVSLETTVNIGLGLLNLFVLIVVSYYLLADGSKIVAALLKLVPREKEEITRQYIHEVDEIVAGIYIGNFFVALVIGLLTVPFLYAFRVPMIALIASLVFLAALIPLFAKWMIWLPISIYLFYTSGIYPAIAFFSLVLIFIDVAPEFFIRPKLIGITSRIHPLLLLLAFIGGGITAGIAGFFGAPVLVGILVGSYNVYTQAKLEDKKEEGD